MQNRLSFLTSAEKFGALSILPCVDGQPLSDLVVAFEEAHSYEPIGGYGGLLPSGFLYGPLDQYFLGAKSLEYFAELNGIYVLGCGDCGEVGCWPLICSVAVSADQVRWSNFRQPHRSVRDYEAFGPFVFDKHQYEQAIKKLVTAVT